MTSGLNAIKLKVKDTNKIMNFEKKLIREYFGLRKNSHIITPYLLLGLEPVENNIEKEVLSLFYNIWNNSNNPVFKICKRILERN